MKITKREKLTQAKVYVMLKDGVLDPQGETIKKALENLGYRKIQQVRSGRFFEIKLNSYNKNRSKKLLEEISRKLLTNPVIENYKIELKK